MTGISKYNNSGCLDLTAFELLNKIDRAEQQAKRNSQRSAKQNKLPSKPHPFIYKPSITVYVQGYKGSVNINGNTISNINQTVNPDLMVKAKIRLGSLLSSIKNVTTVITFILHTNALGHLIVAAMQWLNR